MMHLKNILIYSLLLLTIYSCSSDNFIRQIPDKNKKVIFIGEFKNNSINNKTKWTAWQTGLAQMIEDDLFSIGYFKLISKENRSISLNELAFQQSGLTAKNSLKIGRMLGAEWILSGSFIVEGNLLTMQSKVINVETAKTIASSQSNGDMNQFFNVVKKNSINLLSQFSFDLKSEEIKIINNRIETKSAEASLSNYTGERLLLQIDYLDILANKPGANTSKINKQLKQLRKKAKIEFKKALQKDSGYTKAQLNLNKLTLMLPSSI